MLWFMVSYHDLWAKKIVKLPLMMPGYTHRSPLGVSSLHNGLKSEKKKLQFRKSHTTPFAAGQSFGHKLGQNQRV